MEPCLKAVAQKMLENHINSHQERELRKAFKKYNRALLRPKRPKTSRSRYNQRIKNTQQRIGILSKLLGIPEPNPVAASSDGLSPAGFNPDAVNPKVVNSDAVNRDVVNPDAVNPDAVNLEAVNLDAANPDAAYPDALNPDAVRLDAVNPESVNPDAANPIFMH